MPIAYVHYAVQGGKDDVYDHSPSTAVVVVRKFLEEKLRDHTVVLFQMLGPSPCHVDAFIEETPAGTLEAEDDLTLVGRGYRTFYFTLAAKTPEAQIERFVEEHQEVLAAFYMLVRMRNYAHALRAAVTNGALDLLQAPERAGRWATFQHWRGYRERIDAVFEALLHEKFNRVAQDRHEAQIREDEQVDSSSLFYAFIEREMGAQTKMPDEDIRELLVMLEERRRGYFENTATLVSGLVGGILGATLGALLTFGLSDHNQSKTAQANVNAASPALVAALAPSSPAASPSAASTGAAVPAPSTPAPALPPAPAPVLRPSPAADPARKNE
jgi:hypothetical protein